MNRHLARWLLALYPRAWRDRYGPEVASLNDELISAGETTSLRAGLNLIAGAATERGRAVARSRRGVLAAAAVAIMTVTGIAATAAHAWPSSAATANCLVSEPNPPPGTPCLGGGPGQVSNGTASSLILIPAPPSRGAQPSRR